MNIPTASLPGFTNTSAITRQPDVSLPQATLPQPTHGEDKPVERTSPLPVTLENLPKTLQKQIEDNGETGTTIPLRKAHPDREVESRRIYLYLDAALAKIDTARFNSSLALFDPALASKDFGYTLGPDSRLQVLDPQNNLTPKEKEWLTDALNAQTKLVNVVRNHVQTTRQLLAEYAPCGANAPQSGQNHDSFVIDYRKLDSRDFLQRFDEWVSQEPKGARNGYGGQTARVDIEA